jgi:hypothetical protein
MVGVIFLMENFSEYDLNFIELLRKEMDFKLIDLKVMPIKRKLEIMESEEELEKEKETRMDAFRIAVEQVRKDWRKCILVYPCYFDDQLKYTNNRTYYLPMKLDAPFLAKYESCKTEMNMESFLRWEDMVSPHQPSKKTRC